MSYIRSANTVLVIPYVLTVCTSSRYMDKESKLQASNVKRHCTRRLGCVCHEDRTPKHKKQYKVSVNDKISRGKSKI